MLTTERNTILDKLKSIYSLNRYAKNTLLLLTDKVIRIFTGLVIGVWVIRYLGPEQYGILSYTLAVFSILSTICTLGLDSVVISELVKRNNDKERILVSSFIMRLSVSSICCIVLFILSKLLKLDGLNLIFIASISLVFQSFNVIDFYFQSEVKSKFVVYSGLFSLIIGALLKLALIATSSELVYFIVVTVIEQLILALALCYYFKSFNNRLFRVTQFELIEAKKLILDSWPILISGLCVTLYMRLDQLMINNILGERSLGLYSAGIKVPEMLYFIPMVICSSLFPAIINAKENSSSLYQSRVFLLYGLVIWLAILIAIPIVLFREEIVSLLFGANFIESSSVILIHSWTAVFVYFGVARSKWIVAEGLQRVSLIYIFLSLIVNGILNLILIPIYGILGAALATLVSQICATLIFPMFHEKSRVSVYMFIRVLNFRKVKNEAIKLFKD